MLPVFTSYSTEARRVQLDGWMSRSRGWCRVELPPVQPSDVNLTWEGEGQSHAVNATTQEVLFTLAPKLNSSCGPPLPGGLYAAHKVAVAAFRASRTRRLRACSLPLALPALWHLHSGTVRPPTAPQTSPPSAASPPVVTSVFAGRGVLQHSGIQYDTRGCCSRLTHGRFAAVLEDDIVFEDGRSPGSVESYPSLVAAAARLVFTARSLLSPPVTLHSPLPPPPHQPPCAQRRFVRRARTNCI